MDNLRKEFDALLRKARLKALHEQLRLGIYRVDTEKLTEALKQAQEITPN